MSTIERGDPVLRALGKALWRALPALVLLAVSSFAIGFAVVWFVREAVTLAPMTLAVLLAPVVAFAIDVVHRELFEERTRVSPIRRVGVVALGSLAPAAAATWAVIAGGVARVSGEAFFQIVALGALLAAIVLALMAVVAVPIALRRSDVSFRGIATFSLVALVRRPGGPVAALVATAAVGWLGLTVFSGLLALVAPVLVALSIAAAWTSAARLGVAVPVLAVPGTLPAAQARLRAKTSRLEGER